MTSWFSVGAELIEPVAMSSGDHSRNRAAGHPFITGSAVRGALAARWLRQNGYLKPGRPATPIADPQKRAAFLRAFESGSVRFPFLFPRTPVPLSLHQCKRDPSHPSVDLLDPRHDRGTPVRCPVDGCAGRLDRVPPKTPASRVRTRTAIGDDGVAATSMLYAQEELDEGQRFSGSMAVDDLIDLADWAPVDTPVEVSVGADISTGGRVRLSITALGQGPYPDLAGRRAAWLAQGLPEDVLVLTAQSPLILTDQWLRPAARFDLLILGDILGLDTLGVDPIEVRPFTSARTRPAGGWNPAAGIPKPTDLSMIEGSVVQVRVDAALDDPAVLAHLARVESTGVGWRRAEGFGSVKLWSEGHLGGAVAGVA